MKKINLIPIIFFITTILSSEQSKYNIIYQKQFQQNITAENFLAGFHLFGYVDSLFIPKINFSSQNKFAKIANPIFRLSKLFFTNYLITDYVLTMNHELGHGYRMIEVGGTINKIVYNMPPPFTNEFSHISLNWPTNYTKQQILMINLGGSESNLIFSDLMRKNILLNEEFNYTFSWPYLYSSNDMPGYTAFIKNPASDPNQYRRNLNTLYGENNKVLTRIKIRNYSYLALFTDPMNFYALKSVFYNYLIRGNRGSKVRMIKLNNRLKYLPRFRFEYTPYGPELVYQNYFKLDSTLIQFSFSHSDSELPASSRIKANIWNIKYTDKLSFNFSGQIWKQPEIKFYKNNKLINVDGLGGQLITTVNYGMIKNKNLYGLTFQIGYKSIGYTLGEQLNKGMIIRGGLILKLGNDK